MNDNKDLHDEYPIIDDPTPLKADKSNRRLGKLGVGLLLLIASAGIAYSAYSWIQKDNLKDQVTQKDQQIQSLTSANASLKASTKTDASSTYLNIAEWGIKMKLSANIEGAYYQVVTPTIISLKTHALDVEADCRKSDQSFYSLIKTGKDTVDPEGATKTTKFSDEYKGNGTVVGDNFYYMMHAQYDCVEGANGTLASNAAQAFRDASTTLEKL